MNSGGPAPGVRGPGSPSGALPPAAVRQRGDVQEVAGPGGLGSLLAVLRSRGDPLALLRDLRDRHGDLVRFRLGSRHVYLVSSAAGARQVLDAPGGTYQKGLGLAEAREVFGEGVLTSVGASWARSRRALRDHLEAQQARLPELLAEELAGTEAVLDRCSRAGGPVDLYRESACLTLRVLGRALFRYRLAEEAPAVQRALRIVSQEAIRRVRTPRWVLRWVPSTRQTQFRAAVAQLDQVAHRILARMPDRGPGSLPAALRSRDEVVTLLVAGHETTAATIAFGLGCLASSPDVAAALCRGASPGSAASPAREASVASQVVAETLRLFPPVWLLTRRALRADSVLGARLPPGANVLVCPYLLHRDARYWPDPERFTPSRFRGPAPVAGAYLPFGAGARACPGQAFGEAEAVAVLSHLGRRYRFRPAPGASGRTALPEARADLTLSPVRCLHEVERRSTSPGVSP